MNCQNNQHQRGLRPPYMIPQPVNMDCQCGTPPSTIPPIMPLPLSNMINTNQRANQCRDEEKFPIAMGYVPCQKWGQTFSMERALQRGTIFVDLDLPFMMERCK